MNAVLAPSILSADFARLGEEVAAVEAGGAGLIHVDVMDGHFVPNLTLGPAVTAALKRVTHLPLDCHLMIDNPDAYVDAFVEAGASMVSVHVEAARHLHRTVTRIRELGAEAGVALNPATPLHALDEILDVIDFVLLMSVNPGFGGQKLIPGVLEKAKALRDRLDRERRGLRIEIDGGINAETLEPALAAGVDIVVAGSAIYGAGKPRETARDFVRRISELTARERRC